MDNLLLTAIGLLLVLLNGFFVAAEFAIVKLRRTQAEELAKNVAKLLQLPPKAAMDASHVALSILHKMDYMLTWNCTHLANPVLQKELVEFCGYNELHVPIICTPATLTAPRHE